MFKVHVAVVYNIPANISIPVNTKVGRTLLPIRENCKYMYSSGPSLRQLLAKLIYIDIIMWAHCGKLNLFMYSHANTRS